MQQENRLVFWSIQQFFQVTLLLGVALQGCVDETDVSEISAAVSTAKEVDNSSTSADQSLTFEIISGNLQILGSNATGGSVSAYQVQRKISGTWTVIASLANTVDYYINTGLTPGTVYS